jgi:hypothetical protein
MTLEDISSVETTVALMRRLGIIKMGSIELGPAPLVEPLEAKPATPADLEEMLKGAPEGDDALYWSTTGPLPSEYRSSERPPEE